MKKLIFLTLCIFFTSLFSSQNVQVIMLSNNLVKIQNEYVPNHTMLKNTSNDMRALERDSKLKEFSRAAKLIDNLDAKLTSYFETSEKLYKFYIKKWEGPHYQRMDEKWKEETYAKHREKLLLHYALTTTLQDAYNLWNEEWNKIVSETNPGKLAAALKPLNNALEKTLADIKSKEKEASSALKEELSSIK